MSNHIPSPDIILTNTEEKRPDFRKDQTVIILGDGRVGEVKNVRNRRNTYEYLVEDSYGNKNWFLQNELEAW